MTNTTKVINEDSKNLELWKSWDRVDSQYITDRPGARGKKMSSIDTYYRIKWATQKFGPAGKGWGWEVRDHIVINTEKHSVIQSLIRLWWENRDQYVEVWGGAHIYNSDAGKASVTDGITKCLSYLGCSADVYLGKFVDDQYVDQRGASPDRNDDPSDLTPNEMEQAEKWRRWVSSEVSRNIELGTPRILEIFKYYLDGNVTGDANNVLVTLNRNSIRTLTGKWKDISMHLKNERENSGGS